MSSLTCNSLLTLDILRDAFDEEKVNGGELMASLLTIHRDQVGP